MRGFSISTISLFLLPLIGILFSVSAFDPYDPRGNITIRWDVVSWTPDGYVALVNITNNQIYQTVGKPGWKLSWTWAGREIIWDVIGGQAIDQGDCSKFKGNIPHSCAKNPTIQDLTAAAPFNQQIYGCCRGGTLSSRYVSLSRSTAGFQIAVGAAGTTSKTVKLPVDFKFKTDRGGYTCGPTKVQKPTRFISADLRRVAKAMKTWQVVCTYSASMAKKTPACCVSLSSFNQQKKVKCPTCSCACRNETCNERREGNPGFVPPLMKCSDHMCPTTINWEMMKVPQMKGAPHWAARVSITNYNYHINYSDWTLLVNHPAINTLTKVLHANHKLLPNTTKTSEVMWGIKKTNDIIRTSGAKSSTVNFLMKFYKRNGVHGGGENCKKDWCAPKEIFFNGDRCAISSLTHS